MKISGYSFIQDYWCYNSVGEKIHNSLNDAVITCNGEEDCDCIIYDHSRSHYWTMYGASPTPKSNWDTWVTTIIWIIISI